MTTVSPAAAPTQTGGRSIRLSRLSDELLARHAARGSQRAFTALYERYHQPLYRYCRSILRHDADAQDALQSTFTGALAALQRDARTAPLRPWLYRIAHNESISLLRRRKRDSHYEVVTEFSAIGSSAEEEAAGRARWRRLVDDLAELPERQRGALLLRELAGLSHEEIALTLGLSLGTAKQAIFEAREGLAELEEGRTMSCEEVRERISEGDRRVLRGRRVRSHLRACAGCGAFALAIPTRKAELRALTPVLPPAAAAALLGRTLHAASHGAAAAGSGASAGSAATAGAVGKAASTALILKAAAGVAVLATAAAGVTGLTHVLQHRTAHTQGRPASSHARAAGNHSGAARAQSAQSRAATGSAARHALAHRASQHHPASATSATGKASHHSHGSTASGGTSTQPSASRSTSASHGASGAGHTHGATKTASRAGTHPSSHRHVAKSSTHSHGHPRVAVHTQVHTPPVSLNTSAGGTTGSATKHAQKTASAVTGG